MTVAVWPRPRRGHIRAAPTRAAWPDREDKMLEMLQKDTIQPAAEILYDVPAPAAATTSRR